MASGAISGVRIAGVSAAVPKNRVDNKDFSLLSEEDRAKMIKVTGIESRRVAPAGLCVSDLCEVAAKRLLADLGWEAGSVSGIVFVSQTPDYRLPATACLLQHRLGLPKTCLALDVSLGCSGYVYGLTAAASLVNSLKLKRVLLLVGDNASQTVSPADRSATPLFGDAGTVTALTYDESAPALFTDLRTDGSGASAILMPGGGYRNPLKPEDLELKPVSEGVSRCALNTVLDGAEIFNFTLREIPPLVRVLMSHANVTTDAVDLFIMHQANRFMNEQIRKKLNIPVEKHPYSLDEFGNTSCATLPLTLVTRCRDRLRAGDTKVLMSGFGVGLSWGAVLADLPAPFVCSDLLEI